MSEEDRKRLAFIAGIVENLSCGFFPSTKEIRALQNICDDLGTYTLSADDFYNEEE